MSNDIKSGDSEKIFWIAMMFVCTLVMSQPLLSNELIVSGHDWIFHLTRIEGMKDSLLGGQFPVRITGFTFNGYGEASGLFYPNLFMYIPIAFRLCGLSLAASYNLFCGLINVMTVFFAYWSFSKLFNSVKIGATSAIIYSSFMYRLVDVYSRGALGEALAMAFMPVAVVSLYFILTKDVRYWPVFSLSYSGIIQSHILGGVITTALSVLLLVCFHCQLKNREIVLTLGKSAIFIAALNAWFYFPFLILYRQINFHMQETLNSNTILYDNALGWSRFNEVQGFCGYLGLLIILIFIFLWTVDKIRHKRQYKISRTFSFLLAISLCLLALSFAKYPWTIIESIPKFGAAIGVLQFPYRLMTIATLTFTYCIGYALNQMIRRLNNEAKVQSLLVICCLVVTLNNVLFLSKPTLNSNYMIKFSDISRLLEVRADFPKDWYFMIFKTDISDDKFNEISVIGYLDYLYDDIYYDDVFYDVDPNPFHNIKKRSKIPFDDIEPQEIITNFKKIGTTVTFTVDTPKDIEVTLPLFYFDGYRACTANDVEIKIDSDVNHRVKVGVPAGRTTLTVKYYDKTSWKIANVISILTLIAFMSKIRLRF